MSISERDESTLMIEAAQRGERWAEEEVARLVRAFARYLHRGSIDRHEPEWEEVAQEACRRVFSGALARFEAGGPARSYLYTIVKATRIQLYRSLWRRARREDEHPLEPGAAGNPESASLLARILGRLNDSCRELLERAFFDGASSAELAQELGLVESSVRSRLTRCLQSARDLAR